MSVRALVHPDEIRKSGTLYRSWSTLLQNRLWRAARVPDESHICLWFWPALFSATLFRPLLYPLLVALTAATRMLVVRPAIALGRPAVHIVWRVIRGTTLRLGAFLAVPVGGRMTIGSLTLLALALALSVTPIVNRWFTGVALVCAASYVAAEFIFRGVPMLWRIIKSVGSAFGRQWDAALVSDRGKYRLALAGCVLMPLVALPFVWATAATLVILAPVVLLLTFVFGGLYLLDRLEEWRKIRVVEGAERRAARAALVPADIVGMVQRRRAKTRSPLRIYVSAFWHGLCPKVRFVD